MRSIESSELAGDEPDQHSFGKSTVGSGAPIKSACAFGSEMPIA